MITALAAQDRHLPVFLQIIALSAHDRPSSNNNEHVVV